MQTVAQIATIEYVVNRFGNVFPIIVVDTGYDNIGKFTTVVVPPQFNREQLPLVPHLSMGDSLLVDIPDPSYYAPGTEPTGTVIQVISCRDYMSYAHCPACGNELLVHDGLWCSNAQCNGRLVSRMNYFGSAEGMNSSWLSHRDLVSGLIHVTNWRNMSPVFSQVEWATIDPVVLPENISRDIQGSIGMFINQLRSSVHNPQIAIIMMSSFINAMSYPGLTPGNTMKLACHAVSTNNPWTQLALLFDDPVALAFLLSNRQKDSHDPVMAYISKQLKPFAYEMSRIAASIEDVL